MRYWLLRSEPDAYSWDDLVRDGATEWNGVRNYTARNFLKEMQPGDQALFYHSNTEKAAVGIMEITRAWQPDRSEEHTSELQSRENLVCRLLLEKKKNKK